MTAGMISGRYRLQHVIGTGGMGTVWIAFDTQLHRQVAVKFARQECGDSGTLRKRFAQEARAVAQFQHPNVVQIYDFGIDSDGAHDVPYIIMELLGGEDLETRMRRQKRLSKDQVAHVLTQAARALSTAHATGLIHRDLKPANLFLARSDGAEVLKILDFGIASMSDGKVNSDRNRDTLLVGTPHYMSPEQVFEPGKVDHRSDLYSLGVVAYEALTGQLPLSAPSLSELLLQLCDSKIQFPPPSRYVPELDSGVDDFFARALSRDPAQRFQSARELASTFAALAESGPRTIKVLVVDDEPDVALLMRQRMRQQIRRGTYEFYFAHDGVSALEQIGRHPTIDLLLSDINMPGMDGLTLLDRVSEQHPVTKVVVVSAYGDMRNIREAMNRGAFDFLTKPIDFRELERTIDKTAQYVQALRRSRDWAQENAFLRTFMSTSLLDRLKPMVRSQGLMLCDNIDATVAIVHLHSAKGLAPPNVRPPNADSPDTVVYGLNRAFDMLVPEVTARHGTVEKFVGNSALIIFRDTDHTERALDACLAVRTRIKELREADGEQASFRVSISVDIGSIFYASIGAPSQRRMDYTVLGPPVTNAFYLEAAAGAEQILVHNDLTRCVAGKFDFRLHSSHVLPGEMDSREVFELVGRAGIPQAGPTRRAAPADALGSTPEETTPGDLAMRPTALAPYKQT